MGDNDTMKKGLQMKEKSASVGEMEKSGENEIAIASEELVDSIRPLIEQAKAHVAQSVNSELVLLYWQIGKHISNDLPAGSRAGYGAKVVELVSERLAAEYGKGFCRSNVFHMIRFAEVFDDAKIVQTLSGQLSWSHFVEIIYLKDPLQRQFYTEMARVERWSVRTLRQKIQGMLYERTAISRKLEELARQELEDRDKAPFCSSRGARLDAFSDYSTSSFTAGLALQDTITYTPATYEDAVYDQRKELREYRKRIKA